MELEFEVAEDVPLRIIARDAVESRSLSSLPDLARFVQDRGRALTPDQARRLGLAAALFAALDAHVVWTRDKDSLGKLVDAYYVPLDRADTRRAFGQGLAAAMR